MWLKNSCCTQAQASVLSAFNLFQFALIKPSDQEQLGKERVSFILHFQVTIHHYGKSKQELKAGTMEEDCL